MALTIFLSSCLYGDIGRRQLTADVNATIVFHVKNDQKHAEFINDIVEHSTYALIHKGIKIIRVKMQYDLPADVYAYNLSFEQKKLEIDSNLFFDIVKNDKTGIHVFIVDDIRARYEKNDTKIIGVQFERNLIIDTCARYIVLDDDANVDTLTHELGHFFGLFHMKDTMNMMTSLIRGRKLNASFNKWQLKKMKYNAESYVKKCNCDG